MYIDEFLNPYHGIEFVSAINKYAVYIDSRPRRLLGVYDTLEQAQEVQAARRHGRNRPHAMKETATLTPTFLETSAQYA